MKRERVTLITLGVADLARARAFYQAWGWQTHPRSMEALVLFQMNGLAMALFDLEALAADQDRPGAALGTGAMTLAQNMESEADVDETFARAVAAGAEMLKSPKKAFWGGYSGYFADPDGHVWEIAHNPFWPLDEDGSLTLGVAE
ncbi:VOC family protein [Frigidibacter sp. SD6-1]|uniref:VOC family protein n=1 Tax=Frigidibacter sp. SD6-1 TaxID=3032581 RepID=UPI0024E040E5|nr:VOC family protein [Frigidibacter sp. SD6-1]